MNIVTPTEITSVAWEGELAHPQVMRGGGGKPPIVVIGRPEIWQAAAAMKKQVGQDWTPPLGGTDYWLVRLACTLRRTADEISEATQMLYLRPKNPSWS